jgi:hypothetical protein
VKVKIKKYKDGSRSFTADDDFQRAYVDWIEGIDVPLAIGFETKGAGVGFVYLTRKQAERLRDMLVEVLGE